MKNTTITVLIYTPGVLILAITAVSVNKQLRVVWWKTGNNAVRIRIY